MNTSHTARRTVWMLGAVYFATFASTYLWTLMPRAFEGFGWSGAEIGGIYSLRKVVEGAMMWAWASAMDRGEGRRLVRLQYVLGWLSLAALPWVHELEWATLMILGYSATAGCALPLVDALSMRAVGATRYGRLRAWGAAGFGASALAAAGAGFFFEGYDALAQVAPVAMIATLAIATLATFGLTADVRADDHDLANPSLRDIWGALSAPPLVALMAIGALHWACQAPYNMFFVSLCEAGAMPTWLPGAAVWLGVTCEFIVLAKSDTLLTRRRPSVLLAIAVAVSALRWWWTGQTDNQWVLLGLQALHGLSFGGFLAACIALVARFVPQNLRATGQAFFYLAVFTGGSMLGNSISGVVYDAMGPRTLFGIAGAVELALVPLAMGYIALFRDE